MAPWRTLLRPVAALAGRHAAGQLTEFLAAHERTEQVQRELLAGLMRAAEGTDFGRDYNFSHLRRYEDFASAVPVGGFEDRRPYLDRVFAGRPEALLPPDDPVLMFAVSSGTTGTPKHIPVTAGFLDDYRRGWNLFGLKVLRDHPDGWLRKIVTVVGSCGEHVSPAGLPCGCIGGLLAGTQKWIVRKMYPVPAAACRLAEAGDRYYAAARASLAHDAGILTTANPSSAIRLAETAVERGEAIIRDVRDGTITLPSGRAAPAELARAFRPDPAAARRLERIAAERGSLAPRHVWRPACLTMWTGGTVGLFLPRVRELYGDVPIRDIGLLASEGRMSVPLADGTPAGVAEITSNVLEFIPAEQIESDEPEVLPAWKVDAGGEYFLVLSNRSGLWRYSIDDRVRVTGHFGRSPVFEFLSKDLHTCSMTGEKVTEHQVVAAMREAGRRLGRAVELFVVEGHFWPTPHYRLHVELPDNVDERALAERFDAALRSLNVEYEAKRSSRRLAPVEVVRVPAGTFGLLEARKTAAGGTSEQYKHRFLRPEAVTEPRGQMAG
jgi:hypothetical protein